MFCLGDIQIRILILIFTRFTRRPVAPSSTTIRDLSIYEWHVYPLVAINTASLLRLDCS